MRWSRDGVRTERGFTLVELLVTVLVVGILAAVAIPTFVVAQRDANDAAAKAMAHDAQLAVETAATDASGSYAQIKPAILAQYDPTILTSKKTAKGGPYLSAARGTPTTYTLTVTEIATGDRYTIARAGDGTVTRSCTIPTTTSPPAGCAITGGTKGAW